jgi:hypothetical protein
MKWVISVIIAVVAMMLSSCKPKQTSINGQVFIATQGGENIRLGAVEVNNLIEIDPDGYFNP